MTPNFAEQAEKHAKDKCGASQYCQCFLDGAEHGYRVGKEERDAEIDSIRNDQLYISAANERDQLKARLEAERERSEKLAEALEDAASGLQNAWEDLGNCEEERCVPTIGEVSSCRAYLDDARQALLAAKRDEGDV